jgi:hypothetical protein
MYASTGHFLQIEPDFSTPKFETFGELLGSKNSQGVGTSPLSIVTKKLCLF